MSDTTIVAVVILGGVFLVMAMAIFKAGVEGAVKVWSVMGTLTGVAFGSITSYYFTNESNQQEIRQAKLEKKAVELTLANAADKADKANIFLTSLAAKFNGETKSASIWERGRIISPTSAHIASVTSEDERAQIENGLKQASQQLGEIRKLQTEVVQSEMKAPAKK